MFWEVFVGLDVVTNSNKKHKSSSPKTKSLSKQEQGPNEKAEQKCQRSGPDSGTQRFAQCLKFDVICILRETKKFFVFRINKKRRRQVKKRDCVKKLQNLGFSGKPFEKLKEKKLSISPMFKGQCLYSRGCAMSLFLNRLHIKQNENSLCCQIHKKNMPSTEKMWFGKKLQNLPFELFPL